MIKFIKSFFISEDGATAIEYGLIAAMLSVGIIVALGQVRTGMLDKYEYFSKEVVNATSR